MSENAPRPLSQKLLHAISKGNLSGPEEIILLGEGELCRRLRVSEKDAREVLLLSAEAVYACRPVKALSMLACCKHRTTTTTDQDTKYSPRTLPLTPTTTHVKGCVQRLTFGCPVLDRWLGGGIPTGSIVEVTGQSAVGKTQVCLQLALTAQLPQSHGGLAGGAVYVSTEDSFPTRRLQQMTATAQQRWAPDLHRISWQDHIYVEHASDVASLVDVVTTRIPFLVRSRNVRLVIIDSVTAVFRVDYGFEDTVQRGDQLYRLSQGLKLLSKSHNVAVVVINQVSDIMDEQQADRGTSTLAPALGLLWSNLITTRLLLSRVDRQTVVSLPDMHRVAHPPQWYTHPTKNTGKIVQVSPKNGGNSSNNNSNNNYYYNNTDMREDELAINGHEIAKNGNGIAKNGSGDGDLKHTTEHAQSAETHGVYGTNPTDGQPLQTHTKNQNEMLRKTVSPLSVQASNHHTLSQKPPPNPENPENPGNPSVGSTPIENPNGETGESEEEESARTKGCHYHVGCVCKTCENGCPVEPNTVVRYINVFFSPSVARGKVPYCVRGDGVHFLPLE